MKIVIMEIYKIWHSLKIILSYRLPTAPPIISEKKNFSIELDLIIKNNKTNIIKNIKNDIK